jgi:predicted MPP superfamily phosphohydrolase
MGFVVFISIAELIVILAHALLYFSWMYFFHITSVGAMRVMGIGLTILSLSFISASLLVFWRDNFLTRIIYYLASIWLGFILYLFLTSILTWVLGGIIRLGGINLFPAISACLISLALIYSVYGIWNAANPRLRYIEVTIKNLPPSWRGRTAVQISDVHLGTIWGRRFMERIAKKIAEIKPDIIFITGDLFDGEGDDLAREVAPLKSLAPPLGMYFITGNHETYLGITKTMQALLDIPVTVLNDTLVNIDGMQLLGISYPLRDSHKDLRIPLQMLDSTKPNIVLFHSPVHLDLFKRAGVNFQLAGHTHQGQIWPLNYITNKVYRGYDRGLHVEGDYTIYTSVGTGTWGPPMRTGNIPEVGVIKFK